MDYGWLRRWSHLYLHRPSLSYPTSNPALQVSPLVSWSHGNQLLGEKSAINVSGQTYINFTINPSSQLPPRWTTTNGLDGTKYILDDQTSTKTHYPIPITSNLSPSLKSARFLFCHTVRAHFNILVLSTLGRIEDITGTCIGSLKLNLVQHDLEYRRRFKFELVVISTGIALGHVGRFENASGTHDALSLEDMGRWATYEKPVS